MFLNLRRGKLQAVQSLGIDSERQMLYLRISEPLVMFGFDTIEQENVVRVVRKIFFQFFLQRTVIAPRQIRNLMRMAQSCDQREKVDAHDSIVGIGLQLFFKTVTEKIVIEFIGEVVIYRFTGMPQLLQIIQRILIGITSHIVK